MGETLIRSRRPFIEYHGDSLYADVRGAQSVGITGILLDRDDRFQPDGYAKIQSLDQLLPLLENYPGNSGELRGTRRNS